MYICIYNYIYIYKLLHVFTYIYTLYILIYIYITYKYNKKAPVTRQSRLHRDVSHGPGATADADGGHFAGRWWEDQVRPQKPWYLHGKTQENHVLNFKW
jgi:hypothetical protein